MVEDENTKVLDNGIIVYYYVSPFSRAIEKVHQQICGMYQHRINSQVPIDRIWLR